MNKLFKLQIKFFSIMILTSLLLLLSGCCSKGGSGGVVVNTTGAYFNSNLDEVKSLDIKVNQNGTISKVSAPSGMLYLEAPEADTFSDKVTIRLVENPSIKNESDLFAIGSIIYAIKADRDNNAVKMQQKPLILSFSNEERLSGADNYYIGIRDIDSEEWLFTNVWSSNKNVGLNKEFEYKLYKDNVFVALFSDSNKNLKNKPRVLEAVASLSPALIQTYYKDFAEGIKNRRFSEDLKVNLILSGDELSQIKYDDFKLRVYYGNIDSKQVSIKIDGKSSDFSSGSRTNKYEAFGKMYSHFYEFKPQNIKYKSQAVPELSFDLNLKDFPVKDFSTDFIVEIRNANNNLLPFYFAAPLHIEIKDEEPEPESEPEQEPQPEPEPEPQPEPEPEPEPEPIVLASVSLKSEATNFSVSDSAIQLEFSRDIKWKDSYKDKIKINNNAVIADFSYENKILSISLSNRLNYNSEYQISINGLEVAEDKVLTFSTEEKPDVNIKSVINGFQIVNSNIELEFSKDIPWSLEDRNKIQINNNISIADFSYSNRVLTLFLNERLNFNTDYKISFSGLSYLDNCTLPFRTEPCTVSLKSSAANFAVSDAKLELEFSKDIAWNSSKKDKIIISNNPEILSYTYANRVLSISFKEKLKYNTEYSIRVEDLDGIENNDNLSFSTENRTVTPVITADTDSIVNNSGGRLVLRPKINISYGKTISSPSVIKDNIILNGMALPDSCTISFDLATKTAVLSFNEDLEAYSDFSISMTDYYDGDNASIKAPDENFNFKTIAPIEIRGSGTEQDPYLIYTEAHLRKLHELDYKVGDKWFKQMCDIRLSKPWIPIGSYIGDGCFEDPFDGNYNGNGFEISNIIIDAASNSYNGGLFGAINNADIYNLTIKDVNITARDAVAALVGFSDNSTIRDVKVCGNIMIDSEYGGGGLAGYASDSNISKCCVYSDNGLIEGFSGFGGLIGQINHSTITQCYTRISIQGCNGFGGLIGSTYYSNNINNCYSKCTVIAPVMEDVRSYNFGGLIGESYNGVPGYLVLTNCYSAGTIRITTDNVCSLGFILGRTNGYTNDLINNFSKQNVVFDLLPVFGDYNPGYDSDSYDPEQGDNPLWFDSELGSYVYDTSGTNSVRDGYDSSLNWDSDIWNLTQGQLPTLKGLPGQ